MNGHLYRQGTLLICPLNPTEEAVKLATILMLPSKIRVQRAAGIFVTFFEMSKCDRKLIFFSSFNSRH